MPESRILMVRLGAMGDVLHALPAAASLRRGLPDAHIAWVIDPKWAPLLEGNPHVGEIIRFDRRQAGSWRALWKQLRSTPWNVALDLQGLIKSALICRASRAPVRLGFDRSQLRETLAALGYTRAMRTESAHVVDRNLELARASGGAVGLAEFPLPAGAPEGDLPASPFVLASPLAGWKSKQWPAEAWRELAAKLSADGVPLVVNGPPDAKAFLEELRPARLHLSALTGLIDATRRAASVVGVDSGPMHLAAALGRPGVAIFGPTDPARNGPYGRTFTVLRDPSAETTYRRGDTIADSMRAVPVSAVVAALRFVHKGAGA